MMFSPIIQIYDQLIEGRRSDLSKSQAVCSSAKRNSGYALTQSSRQHKPGFSHLSGQKGQNNRMCDT
jgi:hypothetical protein